MTIPDVEWEHAQFEYFHRLRWTDEFFSIWSMYEVKDVHETVPFTEIKSLVYLLHWGHPGNPTPVTFDSPPTWYEMWRAADRLIVESGDIHHVFVENFHPKGDGVYELITGS